MRVEHPPEPFALRPLAVQGGLGLDAIVWAFVGLIAGSSTGAVIIGVVCARLDRHRLGCAQLSSIGCGQLDSAHSRGSSLAACGAGRLERLCRPWVTTSPTFDERFDALADLAYRIAHRLIGDRGEAENMAQEALARAYIRWDQIATYDEEAWVTRATTNLAIGYWRRHRRDLRHSTERGWRLRPTDRPHGGNGTVLKHLDDPERSWTSLRLTCRSRRCP